MPDGYRNYVYLDLLTEEVRQEIYAAMRDLKENLSERDKNLWKWISEHEYVREDELLKHMRKMGYTESEEDLWRIHARLLEIIWFREVTDIRTAKYDD